MSRLAYGLYVFDPSDITGGTTIHFTWETEPSDYTQFYVGVGNFQQNKWRWFQPGFGSMVFLDSVETYSRVGLDGAMVVAVAMTGRDPAMLKRIWLGAGIAPDTIYAIPEKTVVEPGEIVRVNVFVRDTELPLGPVSVRFLVAEGNGLVENSLNIGVPGGKADDQDGVWAGSGARLVLYGSEGNGNGAPVGYTAFDFTLAPLEANDIGHATGGLFNFQLEVNRSTNLRIVRESQADGLNRTYYSNQAASTELFWENDTNSDFSGIRLSGWPTAILDVNVLSGDTPLSVQFDASESWDEEPGSIVKYEFDFGEGEGYQDYGTNPQASHVYSLHGKYPAYLRVTDNSGIKDVKAILINAKSYDETENNDRLDQANDLPPLSFSGFRGNIGEQQRENVPPQLFDGDQADYYNLDLEPDVQYRFVGVIQNSKPIGFGMDFLDGSGRNLYRIDTQDWQILNTHCYEFVPEQDELPITMHVRGGIWAGDYVLAGMRWPPTAILETNQHSGRLPFQLELNAGLSWDFEDNDIVAYEFDFGDGAGFIDNGNNPIATHTYTVEDLYFPKVKVLDGKGNFDIEKVIVYAGREYDEQEPNNTIRVPQQVTLPMVNFRGNIGALYDYELHEYIERGYDGGSRDYFSFPANAGMTLHVTLDLDSSTANLDLYLMRPDYWVLARSEQFGDHEELNYTVLPGDEGTLLIRVYRQGSLGYSDYVLNAVILGT